MCGRFNLVAPSAAVVEHFQLRRLLRYETSYNIPPGQKILAVVELDDKSRKAVYLWWGLIPAWAKDGRIGQRVINARAETLSAKPSFRAALKQRRCLIPTTGFYEWQQTAAGKQPFHIHREDNGLFAFAGLWECWEHDAQTLYTCTIVTTAASEMMLAIHERMPVIIRQRDYAVWLDKQTNENEITRLLSTANCREMAATAVSEWVNNPRHNDDRCVHPYYKER
jgi:putative SOS response-associated peptidase YedK